jgi:hypothetical protein
VSYAEYSKCRLSLPSCSEFDEVNRRKLMFAEDAMAQWEGLAAEHGAWDVFIAKHVELLERENDIKQCEALLRSYLRTCAVRANGLRLLYWFYVRRGWADTQQAIDILSELSSMVESDDLVLVFYKLISKEVGNIARITVLFNLLDYASSQDNRRAWNFLCKELAVRNNGLSDSSLAKAMDDCWSIRADWWPQYHFAVFSLPDVASDEALDLIVIKATVAFFLMGSDNPFTQAVLPLTDGISNATRAVRRFKRLLERKLK